MKYRFIVLAFLVSVFGYSQDGSLGIVVGINDYATNTGFLSSKSGTGYYVGLPASIDFNRKSQLQLELGYLNNFVKFLGRDAPLGEPKEVRFSMQNLVFNVFYNYSFYENDDLKIGINVGPSFSFSYEYRPVESISEDFVLDPLLAEPYDLLFDTRNENISFNIFAGLGVTTYYKESLVFNLRYFHGLTDPYRQAPVVAVVDVSGKDSYFLFSVGYIWLQ